MCKGHIKYSSQDNEFGGGGLERKDQRQLDSPSTRKSELSIFIPAGRLDPLPKLSGEVTPMLLSSPNSSFIVIVLNHSRKFGSLRGFHLPI